MNYTPSKEKVIFREIEFWANLEGEGLLKNLKKKRENSEHTFFVSLGSEFTEMLKMVRVIGTEDDCNDPCSEKLLLFWFQGFKNITAWFFVYDFKQLHDMVVFKWRLIVVDLGKLG